MSRNYPPPPNDDSDYVLSYEGATGTVSWEIDAGGGGTLDHAALTSNLTWTTSGHTGTASKIAGFDGAGAAVEYAIGTDLQAHDADLDAIAALAHTDSNFIVGNGATWVAESGATARTSLGLGTGDTPQFDGLTLTDDLDMASGDQITFGGAITYIDGVHGGALTLVGYTDVQITASTDDVLIDAADDVVVTADDYIYLVTTTYDIDLDSARAIYLDATTDVDVRIAGTGYARFDGSGRGLYVGSAVANPSERVHVGAGNLRLDSGYRINWGGTTSYIDVVNGGLFELCSGAGNFEIDCGASLLIDCVTSAVYSAGTTMSQTAGSTWAATATTTATLNAGTDIIYNAGATAEHIWQQDGVQVMQYDATGSGLVVGSSVVAQAKLHVDGSIYVSSGSRVNFGGATTYIDGVHGGALTLVGTTDVQITASGDDVLIDAADDIQLAADAVGVNDTTPDYRFTVENYGSSFVAAFRNSYVNTAADGVRIGLASSAPSTSAYYLQCLYSATGGTVGTSAGGIRGDSSGGLGFYSASDTHWKTDIRRADSAELLATVRDLPLVRCTMNGVPDVLTFPAQDLATVYPEATADPTERNARKLCTYERRKGSGDSHTWEERREVYTSDKHDHLAEDKRHRKVVVRPIAETDPEWSWWEISPTALVPPLVGAVQELADAQDKTTAALEARICELERLVAELRTAGKARGST